MSERKTYLSRKFAGPFNFDALAEFQVQDIERSLNFITGQRLSIVLDAIGQDRFVHLSGRSWKQISRYLKGDKAPVEVLTAIATETGTSVDWLAQGTLRTQADARFEERLLESVVGWRLVRLNQPRPEPEWSMLGYGLKLIDERLDALDRFTPNEEGLRTGATLTIDTLESLDFIRLPIYRDVLASAGGGARPASEHTEGIVAFESGFLRSLGAVPSRCSVIRASGDSMQPSIPDGSFLVVDHSQSEIKNGHIMVINLGEDLLVKRVRRRLDGLVDLISDNHAYAPETIGPDMLQQLRVVGRVVYFCRIP